MPTSEQVFLSLEESLSQRLTDRWAKTADRAVDGIVKHIEQDDFASAYEVARTLDLSAALQGNVEYARHIGKMALVFGATRIAMEADGYSAPGKKTSGKSREVHFKQTDKSRITY